MAAFVLRPVKKRIRVLLIIHGLRIKPMQDLAKKLHAAFAEAVARPATHPSGKNQDDHNAMVKQCVMGWRDYPMITAAMWILARLPMP
jgi:hypothetical protein